MTSEPKLTRTSSLTMSMQIGLQHGSEAKLQISRCIDFYADLFLKSAKKNWHEVRELAMMFEPTIRKNWPAYLEEMEGKHQTRTTRTSITDRPTVPKREADTNATTPRHSPRRPSPLLRHPRPQRAHRDHLRPLQRRLHSPLLANPRLKLPSPKLGLDVRAETKSRRPHNSPANPKQAHDQDDHRSGPHRQDRPQLRRRRRLLERHQSQRDGPVENPLPSGLEVGSGQFFP